MRQAGGFDKPCACGGDTGLGADQQPNDIDTLIQNTVSLARDLFPNQTAAAEEWISQRLLNYGVNYAQYKAGQYYQTATDYLSNPYVVLGLGLFAGWFFFGRRR